MNITTHAESFVVQSIGYIESKYNLFNEIPHPHGKKGWNDDSSTIVLYPEHANKITGLEGYSHLIVLFWNHRLDEWKMPEHHHHKPENIGLFATRKPTRPNPISLSVVELLPPFNDGRIPVKGLDALNETPVIDIKPYIPHFDSYPEAGLPEWVESHLEEHHHH